MARVEGNEPVRVRVFARQVAVGVRAWPAEHRFGNGVEQQITSAEFDSRFDYRIDSSLGHIELQGASLVDQGGKTYIRGASNYGDGYLKKINFIELNTNEMNFRFHDV